MLELIGCGITDISGLENAYCEQLILSRNEITDARAIGSMNSLYSVWLLHNPVREISLPNRHLNQLYIRGTQIDNLEFLENVPSMSSFNCIDTKVTDISIIAKFYNLKDLSIPDGVDYSMINTNALDSFYVGNNRIKGTK